jgi:hypothetical protein
MECEKPTNMTAPEWCPWCASPRKARGFATFLCGVTATTVKPSAMRPGLTQNKVRVSDQTPACHAIHDLRDALDEAIVYVPDISGFRERHADAIRRLPSHD